MPGFLGFWESFFREYWASRVEAQVWLGGLVGWLGRQLVVLFFGLRWSGAAVWSFSGGWRSVLRMFLIRLRLAGILFVWVLVGRQLRVVDDRRGRGRGPRQYRGLGRGPRVGAGLPALRAGGWFVSC